jgi:hypothetical protein
LFIESSLVGVVGRGVLEAAATARWRGLVLRSRIVAIVRHSEKGMLGIDESVVEFGKGEGSRKQERFISTQGPGFEAIEHRRRIVNTTNLGH